MSTVFIGILCSFLFMKARLSSVPKKIIRVSKKVLKAPGLVLKMPKDILDISLEMSLDLLNASMDILADPTKISKVPKQLLHIPGKFLSKAIKTLFTVKADFKDSNFMDQEAILISLINKCKKTAFGRKYGFARIKTIQDFQKQVPVFHYQEFEPWIHHMVRGARNISYPGKIDWFATSSGTTGTTSKYLPVTMEGLKKCHFKGSLDLLTFYIKNNPKSKFFEGK